MKKCPRCRSSFIRTGYDRYGAHELCLNCGWTDNGITKGRRIQVAYESASDGQVAASAEEAV